MEFFDSISGLENFPEIYEDPEGLKKYIPQRLLRTAIWEKIVNGGGQEMILSFTLPKNPNDCYRQSVQRKSLENVAAKYNRIARYEAKCLDELCFVRNRVENQQKQLEKLYSTKPWYTRWFGIGGWDDPKLLCANLKLLQLRKNYEDIEQKYNKAWDAEISAGKKYNRALFAYKRIKCCRDRAPKKKRCTNCGRTPYIKRYIAYGTRDFRTKEWFNRDKCGVCDEPLKFAGCATGNSNCIDFVYYPCDCIKPLVDASNAAEKVYCKMLRENKRYSGSYKEFPCYSLDAERYSAESCKIWENNFSKRNRRQAWYYVHDVYRLGWPIVNRGIEGHPDPVAAVTSMCTAVVAIKNLTRKSKFLGHLKPLGFNEHKNKTEKLFNELLMAAMERICAREQYKLLAEYTATIAADRNDEKNHVASCKKIILNEISERLPQLMPVSEAISRQKNKAVLQCILKRPIYEELGEYHRRKNYKKFIAQVARTARKRKLLKKMVGYVRKIGKRESIKRKLLMKQYSIILKEITERFHIIRWHQHRRTLCREIPNLAHNKYAVRIRKLRDYNSRKSALVGLKWSLKGIPSEPVHKWHYEMMDMSYESAGSLPVKELTARWKIAGIILA